MILHPTTEIPLISLHRLKDDAAWLKTFLTAQHICIKPGSVVDKVINTAELLPEWSANPQKVPDSLRMPAEISKAAGLAYLAKLLRQAAATKHFLKLKKLLRNVAESDPVMTVPGISTQERNFVFELELGCLCACSDMVAESHDEPDIVATKEAKWNFACKMIYSQNSATVGNNIEKGITQILRFPSDYGMVVVGLSNRMPEERFLPLLDKENDVWGSFVNVDHAKARLANELNAFLGQVQAQATTRFTDGENPRFRGILVISHTACGVGGILAPLTAVALIHRMDIQKSKSIIGPEKELAEKLNRAAQNVFSE